MDEIEELKARAYVRAFSSLELKKSNGDTIINSSDAVMVRTPILNFLFDLLTRELVIKRSQDEAVEFVI